jgi:hypothetical protein
MQLDETQMEGLTDGDGLVYVDADYRSWCAYRDLDDDDVYVLATIERFPTYTERTERGYDTVRLLTAAMSECQPNADKWHII